MDILDQSYEGLRRENEALREELANRPTLEYAGRYVYLYVSKSGDDGNPGTEEKPFLTVMRAVQSARTIIGAERIFIRIGAGLYEESLQVYGFYIPIDIRSFSGQPEDVEISGNGDIPTIGIYGVTAIDLRWLTLSHKGNHTPLTCNTCGLNVEGCIINQTQQRAEGIAIIRSIGRVVTTQINNASMAVHAYMGSNLCTSNLSGSGNSVGVQSNCSTVYLAGTLPGATTETRATYGGQIFR